MVSNYKVSLFLIVTVFQDLSRRLVAVSNEREERVTEMLGLGGNYL